MSDPTQFNATFNAAYVVLLVVYIFAAVFGFYTFGDITYSPILCNFPRSTDTTMGAVTASTKLLIAFHVMSAYPILMTVLTTEIEAGLGWTAVEDDVKDDVLKVHKVAGHHTDEDGHISLLSNDALSTLSTLPSFNNGDDEKVDGVIGCGCGCPLFVKRTVLRTTLVVLTCSIAIFLPFFGLLMELVGALCLTMMVFILPVLFSFSLWGHEMTMAQKVFGIFIVAVGAIGGLIGTVQALDDIYQNLLEGKHE